MHEVKLQQCNFIYKQLHRSLMDNLSEFKNRAYGPCVRKLSLPKSHVFNVNGIVEQCEEISIVYA